MKGAGETISTIVMIVVVVIIFSALATDAFSQSIKRQKIVLEETELLRVKNTFFLVNRSLAETWRLSTIQDIFQTADASIECGFDQQGKNLLIGGGYWLRTPPTSGGTTNRLSAGGEPLYTSIPPKEEKYNSMATPVICGPKRNHLDEVLNRKMEKFLKPPNFNFRSNGLDVDVRGVASAVKSFDDYITSDTGYELEVSAGGCANSMSCSKTLTRNVSSIHTVLARMVDTGRRIVYEDGKIKAGQGELTGSLLGYSIAFLGSLVEPEFNREFANPDYMPAFRYQDVYATETFGFPITNGKEDYLSIHMGILNSIILTEKGPAGELFRKDALKAGIQSSFRNLELVSPCRGTGCEQQVYLLPQGTGLIFHYDLTITMKDKNEYYYHNEESNSFAKRPVELQIKAEDYLVAIDCTEQGILERICKLQPNCKLQRVFNWEPSKKQLMCYQGVLYSCGDLKIKNFPSQQIVQPGNNMPGGFYACTAGGITP